MHLDNVWHLYSPEFFVSVTIRDHIVCTGPEYVDIILDTWGGSI